MAKVLSTTHVIPTAPPIKHLTLQLTLTEAEVLRDMLYITGGPPRKSRREHVVKILDALIGAIGYNEARAPDIEGRMYFMEQL